MTDPAGFFTLRTPDHPDGFVAPITSANRIPLPVLPAMISSPPDVTCNSVWSERLEPGPRTVNGASPLSLATTRSAPHAIPAPTVAVWYPHVRAYPRFGSLPCWRHAPHAWNTLPAVQPSV